MSGITAASGRVSRTTKLACSDKNITEQIMIAHINPKMPLKQAAAIVGWVAVVAVLLNLTIKTAYWATKKPLVGPLLSTEKMGKPTGEWTDFVTGEVRSVHESLKGHTTVLVFTVLSNGFVGHPVGSMGYQRDIQRLGSETMDALASFITLTGECDQLI